MRIFALLESDLESDSVFEEAHVPPHKAGRIIVTAHPAEHDYNHPCSHQVAVPLVSNPVGLRKAHDLLPLKSLLPVDRIKAEPPHGRATDDSNRRRLRRLVGEEVDLLVEGNRGRRGLHLCESLGGVRHRL